MLTHLPKIEPNL